MIHLTFLQCVMIGKRNIPHDRYPLFIMHFETLYQTYENQPPAAYNIFTILCYILGLIVCVIINGPLVSRVTQPLYIGPP